MDSKIFKFSLPYEQQNGLRPWKKIINEKNKNEDEVKCKDVFKVTKEKEDESVFSEEIHEYHLQKLRDRGF